MRQINIPVYIWIKLIWGLKKRGHGKRESGGLLLCKNGNDMVSRIVFYDQFDKTVSDSGIIEFKGAMRLYKYLANENLEVLADIHTHPTLNTVQSVSDSTHPIIRIKGHIAIIAPNFAKNLFMSIKDCSVYEYLGEFEWRKFDKNEIPITIKCI
jgi:proteasome lid subunit RPN8/RPN11